MRLHYGTLNLLPRETFVAEAKLACDLEGQSPGILARSPRAWGSPTTSPSGRLSHAA